MPLSPLMAQGYAPRFVQLAAGSVTGLARTMTALKSLRRLAGLTVAVSASLIAAADGSDLGARVSRERSIAYR